MATKKAEQQEYLIPVEWTKNAHIPVMASSLQDAIDRVGMMDKSQLEPWSVDSDDFHVRNDLLDELNPTCSEEELSNIQIILDAEDDSRDSHGDRNLEAQNPQD